MKNSSGAARHAIPRAASLRIRIAATPPDWQIARRLLDEEHSLGAGREAGDPPRLCKQFFLPTHRGEGEGAEGEEHPGRGLGDHGEEAGGGVEFDRHTAGVEIQEGACVAAGDVEELVVVAIDRGVAAGENELERAVVADAATADDDAVVAPARGRCFRFPSSRCWWR